jgi:SAM-dependent methyltransferase
MKEDIGEELLRSGFITRDDAKRNNVILDLPVSWWSRPYEYAWAEKLLRESDVVLDAACGLGHPFKFFLAGFSREVHACDIDERILSEQAILDDIRSDFGEGALKDFPLSYLRKIRYSRSDLTSLPYANGMFDRIFCISVLEHLKDSFNRHPWMRKMPFLNYFVRRDIFQALKEFERTLKKDGLIVLTFDYPDINLDYLKKIMPALGLKFAGVTSFEVPDNAIYSRELDIYCFRAVLAKNQISHHGQKK